MQCGPRREPGTEDSLKKSMRKSFPALPFKAWVLDGFVTQGGAALCPGLICCGPSRQGVMATKFTANPFFSINKNELVPIQEREAVEIERRLRGKFVVDDESVDQILALGQFRSTCITGEYETDRVAYLATDS